jgi:hypothetical protein
MRYEQSEIVPLEMGEQDVLADFGKGRRQVDHAAILGEFGRRRSDPAALR